MAGTITDGTIWSGAAIAGTQVKGIAKNGEVIFQTRGSGTGTIDDPKLIYTSLDFYTMRSTSANVALYYELANDIDMSEGYPNAPYLPAISYPLRGGLDGAGYTISNITLKATNSLNYSLFGVGNTQYAQEAYLKNINLDINIIDSYGTTCSPLGDIGVPLEGKSTIVENVNITGNITNDGNVLGNYYGFAYRIGVGLGAGIIRNCHTRVNINISRGSIGGFIGGTQLAAKTDYQRFRIEKCSTGGQRNSSSTSYVSTSNYIGGFIEKPNSNVDIDQCYCFGDFTFIPTSGTFPSFGGFAGTMQTYPANFTNCYSKITVSKVSTATTATGIGGFQSVLSSVSPAPKFENCYTVAAFTNFSTIAAASKGGFIQNTTANTCTNCYYDSTVSGLNSTDTNGGSAPLTTAQLKSGLPAGFDPTIWVSDPERHAGYPDLINNPFRVTI